MPKCKLGERWPPKVNCLDGQEDPLWIFHQQWQQRHPPSLNFKAHLINNLSIGLHHYLHIGVGVSNVSMTSDSLTCMSIAAYIVITAAPLRFGTFLLLTFYIYAFVYREFGGISSGAWLSAMRITLMKCDSLTRIWIIPPLLEVFII